MAGPLFCWFGSRKNPRFPLSGGFGLPAKRLGAASGNSLWPDGDLWGAGGQNGSPGLWKMSPGRRRRRGQQPHQSDGPLPPGCRFRRQAHRLCLGAGTQKSPAGPGAGTSAIKEITLDHSADSSDDQGLFLTILGFRHLLNLDFLQFVRGFP